MAYHNIVETQRKYFLSDATLPLEKRKEALNTLKRLIEENKDGLGKVVHKDLKRVSLHLNSEQ